MERGRGGGLVCGGGWALERSIGKTACGLDGGEEETGREGETDGLTGLSRNGSPAQSGYDVRGSVCCLALTSRRSLWRTCSDAVCASSRNGCFLDTSGGVYPGGGVEE